MQRLRQPAHVVERGLRDLAESRAGRPAAASLRRLLAGAARASSRSRSGSGRTRRAARARSRAAWTRASRSAAAPARAARPTATRAARTAGGSSGSDTGWWRRSRQRRGEEPVDLALHLAVDVLHLLRRLLFALVVLDEQPRHRRAQRRLPRLQRQPDLRACFVFLPGPARARRSGRRRPRTARAGWRGTARCSGVRRATATSSCACSASSRSVRMRSNCADHAVSGYGSPLSSMSRIASAELVQIVLDAQQLQRVAPVAIGQVGLQTRAGPRSGREMYQEYATTVASVMISPSSSAVVGDRPGAREAVTARGLYQTGRAVFAAASARQARSTTQQQARPEETREQKGEEIPDQHVWRRPEVVRRVNHRIDRRPRPIGPVTSTWTAYGPS